VRTGGNEVHAAVEQALLDALTGRPPGLVATCPEGLEAHGRLDAATMARVAASAMAEVVAPAAHALLRGDASIASIASMCVTHFAPSA
jgi:hypothetical protein